MVKAIAAGYAAHEGDTEPLWNSTGKRLSFCSIQLSHHVPSQEGETLRIRTGMEQVIAHYPSENFACAAKRNGKVIGINEKLGLLKLEYDLEQIKTSKEVSLNIKKDDIKKAYDNNTFIYMIRSDKDASKIKQGNVVNVNDTSPFEVVEKLPFKSLEDVPDTSMLTQKEFRELKEGPVVYIRLSPKKHKESEQFEIFSFGESFTSVSGTYLKQTNVLNVKEGEKFKKGDILVYNSGFFEKDPDSKQVNWKHGLTAKIALIEKSETIEDSCEISSNFSKRLHMSPAHLRTISITNNTLLTNIVKVGDVVETTDYLMIMEEGDLNSMDSIDDPETMEFLASLNRSMPTAKYHGTIAAIRVYHACPFEDLHPSIQELVKKTSSQLLKKSKEVRGTSKERQYLPPHRIPVGTKYQGVDFEEDTVMITIMIDEDLQCGPGDKLVIGAQAKTVIGAIMPSQAKTESGDDIDMFFGATAVNDRIIYSPFVMGVGERVMHTLEDEVVSMYFDT
jgi:hypothetical protein